MITPEDILNIDTKTVSIEEIESRIDASILRNHCDKVYEEARIYNYLPMHYIRKIASKYINDGWNYIYVSVTDNNIISFKFSDTEIIGLNDPHKVYTANSVDIYEP